MTALHPSIRIHCNDLNITVLMQSSAMRYVDINDPSVEQRSGCEDPCLSPYAQSRRW